MPYLPHDKSFINIRNSNELRFWYEKEYINSPNTTVAGIHKMNRKDTYCLDSSQRKVPDYFSNSYPHNLSCLSKFYVHQPLILLFSHDSVDIISVQYISLL